MDLKQLQVTATGTFDDAQSWTLRIGRNRQQFIAHFHVRHLLGGVAEIVIPLPIDDRVTLALGGSSFGHQLYFALSGRSTSVIRLKCVGGRELDVGPLYTSTELGVRAFATMQRIQDVLTVTAVDSDGVQSAVYPVPRTSHRTQDPAPSGVLRGSGDESIEQSSAGAGS